MHCTEPWRNSSWHYPVQLQPPASQTCGKHQGQEWVLSKWTSFFTDLHYWPSVARWSGPDLPVRGGDGVIDGQLERIEVLQATSSHVWEQKPVSNTELREQAALHHVVQLVQGRTPQAAGVHRLLSRKHMLDRRNKLLIRPLLTAAGNSLNNTPPADIPPIKKSTAGRCNMFIYKWSHRT